MCKNCITSAPREYITKEGYKGIEFFDSTCLECPCQTSHIGGGGLDYARCLDCNHQMFRIDETNHQAQKIENANIDNRRLKKGFHFW